MNRLSILAGTSVLVVGVTLATAPAQAFVLSFDSTSSSSNSPATGASGTANFSFTQQGSNVLLTVGLTNTTGSIPAFGLGATQATLVGFGFDLVSGLTVQSYNPGSSAFTKLYGEDPLIVPSVEGSASLPPFGTYDVGVRSAGQGNFTGGNPTSGLTAGQSASVSFLLSGTSIAASGLDAAFSAGFQDGTLGAVTRFQQVNPGGSDKLKYNAPTNAVPEPLTMLGAGAAASFGAFFKKRLAKVNQKNA